MKKIISVVGTRPNFVKLAPLCRALSKFSDRIEHKLCHTGQHFDVNMSDVFFKNLGMPEPDYFLNINKGSHGEVTGQIMIEFEKILLKEKPDIVVVAGDVNSTMACAITAVKLGIKVAHIESGLRSRDKSMPEEINRIITDSISDFLFVSEKSGLDNLIKEGVDSSNIYFVGNIMIDSLAFLKKKIIESDILKSLGIKKKEYILVTFHRPSNVDSKQSLEELIDFLNNLSLKTRIVFPVHPRTLHNIRKFDLENSIYGNVIITPPLGYIEFQNLIMNASAVVTDSGGVQEETTYLGVPCLTVRDNTERPITIEVGTNQLCGTDLKTVTEKAREILAGKIKKGTIPELWDGRTADRIVDVLINELK